MSNEVKIDKFGFREYDARWVYEKDINKAGIKDLGKGFGLFTFSARSTAFIGPLLVGTLTYFVSQKYALLAVIPLFYIGYYLFKKLETS